MLNEPIIMTTSHGRHQHAYLGRLLGTGSRRVWSPNWYEGKISPDLYSGKAVQDKSSYN